MTRVTRDHIGSVRLVDRRTRSVEVLGPELPGSRWPTDRQLLFKQWRQGSLREFLATPQPVGHCYQADGRQARLSKAVGWRNLAQNFEAGREEGDVHPRRGDVAERRYPVLVPVRNVSEQPHRPALWGASIRLVPLNECSEVVGDPWEPTTYLSKERGGTLGHWELDVSFLSRGHLLRSEYADQAPRGVIERGSEVGNHIPDQGAPFNRKVRDLCGDQLGYDNAELKRIFLQPYFSPEGLGLVIRDELLAERLQVFQAPLQLHVAALEGLHDA